MKPFQVFNLLNVVSYDTFVLVSNVNKSNEVKVNENETSIKSKPIEVNNMIKPKKVPLQPLRNPNKKKITDPIVINIGNILEVSISFVGVEGTI